MEGIIRYRLYELRTDLTKKELERYNGCGAGNFENIYFDLDTIAIYDTKEEALKALEAFKTDIDNPGHAYRLVEYGIEKAGYDEDGDFLDGCDYYPAKLTEGAIRLIIEYHNGKHGSFIHDGAEYILIEEPKENYVELSYICNQERSENEEKITAYAYKALVVKLSEGVELDSMPIYKAFWKIKDEDEEAIDIENPDYISGTYKEYSFKYHKAIQAF